ncbi:MAG: gluconate 2-dehydrogenase subunit 3 family protein [Candidatus Melainabacteria bacterium]|nr:gluconate 2-dehydrogenase subunit 3 family protein [Candidatus Melainabacteria bacterium]
MQRVKKFNMNRRDFLIRVLALPGILSAVPLFYYLNQFKKKILDIDWLTLRVVQEHLFPSDTDSPGAKEINATSYLQFVLSDPFIEKEEKKIILSGIHQLNETAMKSHKKQFVQLTWNKREKLLGNFSETKDGEEWLSTLITYIFEALFSDPVYGGNPDSIGWKWIGYKPPYPRPPKNKRYFELKKL